MFNARVTSSDLLRLKLPVPSTEVLEEIHSLEGNTLTSSIVRIPRSSGHPFHKHLTTDSTVIRPPIPRVSDH